MKKKLSLFSLAMLIIAAIDSIRNLPSNALFGSSLIFFFIFGAVFFLFPTALVSAQLTANYPNKGGVYHWVYLAFGEKPAMVAIWLQWINTMVWYPSMLSFIAATFAYLLNPDFASHRGYLGAMVVSIFWILTAISLRGIHFSAKLNSILAVLGTILPMFLLIGLGGYWVFSERPLMISFALSDMLPNLMSLDHIVSLTVVMASYLGMELAGVHITDVKNPQKNFPKVLLIAASFILISMLLGSLSIAVIMPDYEINLVAGVIQVFSQFFSIFNLGWVTPFLAIAIVLGSAGGLINWLTSPAKELLHAAEFGFLPRLMTKKNEANVPYVIMLLQAIAVTLCSLAYIFVPSVNAFYWFLTGLSTNLYMLMYVLLFLSGIKLHKKRAFVQAPFKISKNPIGLYLVSLFGLIGCAITVMVGFFPPPEIQIQNKALYALTMGFSMVILASGSFLFFFCQKKSRVH